MITDDSIYSYKRFRRLSHAYAHSIHLEFETHIH